MREPKVHRSVRLTQRQVATLEAEAYRQGISACDMLRRVLDEWLARRKAEGAPVFAERGKPH